MPQSIHSPHKNAIIDSLQYQGNKNDCAPCSLATVINALSGMELSGAELAEQMNIVTWKGILPNIRRIPNWATFPWGIVDVFREYGFNANWGLFYSSEHLITSLLKGNISLPILSSWRPLWAHVMTLVSWDSERGWGFANTQYDIHQVYWVTEDQFQELWKSTARMCVEVYLT